MFNIESICSIHKSYCKLNGVEYIPLTPMQKCDLIKVIPTCVRELTDIMFYSDLNRFLIKMRELKLFGDITEQIINIIESEYITHLLAAE